MGGFDRDSVKAFYSTWFTSMEQGDVNRFLGLLDKNFYLKSPGSPAISNLNELKEQLQHYHKAYQSEVEWEIEEIRFFEDKFALARVSENVKMTRRGSNDKKTMSGIHMALLEFRGVQGWKLKWDVSSMNQPMNSH